MILYLDTSALVKLYVRERGSAGVRALVEDADAVATSVVAYPEARAAFARLLRERPSRGQGHRRRVAQLDRDWERYARVELSSTLVHDAGACAEQFGLRGFDAIHLASARWLKSVHDGEFAFAAFDDTLSAAALAAGLTAYSRTRMRSARLRPRLTQSQMRPR